MSHNFGPRFLQAVDYAIQLHGDQTRKGSGERNVSYVTHLLSVAALVGEMGGTEDELIAALLHDAIEDRPRNGKTEQDIAALFGFEVGLIVQGCTNIWDSKDMPMRFTKPTYIRHLRGSSESVRRVALADKLHNARTTLMNLRADGGDAVWSRFRGGRDGTLEYYRLLSDMFAEVMPGEFSKELTATVYQMHALAGS